MKKRIVSMILALSMMLSILPVSAFADAGAGLSSAAAEETNSITYSSENEYEDVGTNSETKNQVVKIKTGTNGLPKAASGTGWSFEETTGLTITGVAITGVENTNIEYILDGPVSCDVTICNAAGVTVYLLNGVVTRKLRINADNMYGVYVLGGSYADVELNLGTIDGGTYDKLTENGGNVRGGFFRDISGLSARTQQQAHQLLLPENCTLNGRNETGDIYIIKPYNFSGKGNDLELVVESDTGCDAWAVVSTGGSAMALPAGTQNYPFTYFGSTIATVSISHDGKTLSASFNMIPAQDDAPMKLVPVVLGTTTELRFNNEGQPDLTDVTYVDSLDTDAKLHRVYMGNGWGYNCYPNDSSNESTLQILNQGGANFDFSALSDVPINCYVEITNANITGGEFGENGRLTITSGKISGGTFHNVSAGINSINGNSAVEITGGTFDSLFCNGSCSIANAVIQSCNFNTYGNNTYTISDTVLGELPDGIQKLLPAGQQLSTLVVRNGGVTAMNGRTLPLSTNTIYLVGAGSAELTLNTDVLSINDAPVENYNANTSADGKVLRITGKNDGAKIFVNKSTDLSDLKPLRITEEGLPDLTGVTGVPVSGEGMTANLYEGLGWKYATKKENGRTRAALYITTPDGNPVNLASGAINPYHKAIAVEQITFANVTVTGIVAEGSVGAENTIIQDGTFQKDVYADDNSTIAGGTFQDVVRAYGTITGGAFNAVVQLNQNSEVTGGVFHDIQLPSYATEKTVIQNAMILGSLKTDGDSKAAVSNTVSCGYIESKYLAAGQQQSKLMMTDGTVERLNDYAAATDAVYLIGNVKAEIRFSNTVTNINGAEASNYNEGTETSVFKSWSCTGLELTEEQRTARVVYFTMPDHGVNLVAEFVTPTKPDPAPENYKLIVSYAKVTLKDGSAVADLKAVPMGTELKATADEDTETSVFKSWSCTGLELTEEQRTARVLEFTMPDHDVNLKAVFEVPATPDPKPDPTPDPDPTPAPGGDSDGGGAAIVAVAAVGGAAIGVGAYIAGTTAYLKSVLPEGMAIPANRQQLAVALWTAAGKPATQSTALFNDVAADAAELQAIRWVVETGLMSAQDGNFKPGSRVGRLEVIRTWKTYQQRG